MNTAKRIRASLPGTPHSHTPMGKKPPTPPTPIPSPVVIHTPAKMKGWPENPSALVDYDKLVSPLKSIIRSGYKLIRRDVFSFDYDGFDLGKQEREIYPSPKVRFSKEALEADSKRGTNLIDVVLNMVFLLGIEQGRRTERRANKPMELLLETLDQYREMNKDLRLKIDELELRLTIKEVNSNASSDELDRLVAMGLEERRAQRIQKLKDDLQLDTAKSGFGFKTPHRAKFKELEKMVSVLTIDKCSLDQWKEILKEKGWTYLEWQAKCKKKSVKTIYS